MSRYAVTYRIDGGPGLSGLAYAVTPTLFQPMLSVLTNDTVSNITGGLDG